MNLLYGPSAITTSPPPTPPDCHHHHHHYPPTNQTEPSPMTRRSRGEPPTLTLASSSSSSPPINQATATTSSNQALPPPLATEGPVTATASSTQATATGGTTRSSQRHHQRSRRSTPGRTTTSGGGGGGGRAGSPPRLLPRYHINNFDTGGMPVSLWGMDRRDVWRTCFCFHVRTVTIFIGVWYLMIYILELSFNAALLMYEPGEGGYPGGGITVRPETMLPTPVSKIALDNPKPFEIPNAEKLTIDHRPDLHARSNLDSGRNAGPLHLVLDPNRKATSQVILLTVCNMLITLLMVYGAVRGKPSYLMPFFVLRVFDFCIFCLTMVNYFSYLPNVTEGIMNNNGMPFREEFLKMDRQLLSFITLIFIVAFIAVKAYIIGVIWNCYKYLMLRNTVIRGVIAYRHDDPTNIMGLQQNLLPDLPDYETAVSDPRYAKKPPSDSSGGTSQNSVVGGGANAPRHHHHHNNNHQHLHHPHHNHLHHHQVQNSLGGGGGMVPPPPPYSVAVASEPLYLVMPSVNVNQAEEPNQNVPQQHQNQLQQAPAQAPSPPNNNNNNIGGESEGKIEEERVILDEETPAPAPPAFFLPVQSIQKEEEEEPEQAHSSAGPAAPAPRNV